MTFGGLTPVERAGAASATNPARYARAVEHVEHRATALRRVFGGRSLVACVVFTSTALEVGELLTAGFLNDLAKYAPESCPLFRDLSGKECFLRLIEVWNCWIVCGEIVLEGYGPLDLENPPRPIQDRAYPGIADATFN